MNHVFKTINEYHQNFESYKDVVTLKSPWVWLSILALMLFGYSFFWYIDNTLLPLVSLPSEKRIFFVILFEVITLLCWFKLQIIRDRVVINRIQKLLETEENDILKLKSMWFEDTLGQSNTTYLKLADDIDKLISLREKHQSNLSLSMDKKQIAELLFSSESKNRVLAMFMGICASIMGLSIAGGATINNVFEFYEKESLSALFWVAAKFSVLVILSFLVFRYILLVLLLMVELMFDKADGMNSTSSRRASIFIDQLIALHQLEKHCASHPNTRQHWYSGRRRIAYLGRQRRNPYHL
jgi:hypothetical protein